MPLILLFVWIAVFMSTNSDLFRRTVLQKCRRNNIVLWITACEWKIPTSCNPYQNSALLWWIFSSNKSAPANSKKEFYTNRDPNKQEVGFIFVWSGSELWSLLKYSEQKLKNQKPIAVDVLFQAFPMVPCTLMQIQSGRTVPLNKCPVNVIVHAWC
jgi:hypothetical protein